MNVIIEEVRRQLKANADEKTRLSGERFFKHTIRSYGVKSATVGKIAGQIYKSSVKDKSKKDIFDLCLELWRSGYMEEGFVACEWSYNLRKNYQPEDFLIFDNIVSSHIRNWASCDTFCNHTVRRIHRNVSGLPFEAEEMGRFRQPVDAACLGRVFDSTRKKRKIPERCF